MWFKRKPKKSPMSAFVTLHTGDPTADNQIGTRKPLTWSSTGENNSITFNIPSTETITHIGLWSAAGPKRSKFRRMVDRVWRRK